jgi:hypothetical protein
MLLATSTALAVKYAFLVPSAFATWVFTRKSPRKALTVSAAAVCVIAASIWIPIWLGTTDAVVVRHGSDGRLVATRELSVRWRLRLPDEETTVVNETDEPLRLVHLVYTVAPENDNPLAPTNHIVAAHDTETIEDKVDYVGPDHPPPQTARVKLGGEDRWWLTWEHD